MLFQRNLAERLYGTDSVTQTGQNTFVFQHVRYSHGLAIHSALLSDITDKDFKLPISVGVLFFEANHPDVSLDTIPRPTEWQFDMWDRVFYAVEPEGGYADPSRITGRIKGMTKDAALISMDDEDNGEAGELYVPWRHIYKRIDVGDNVTFHAPATAGLSGSVVEVFNHIATVAYTRQRHVDSNTIRYGIFVLEKEYLVSIIICRRSTY